MHPQLSREGEYRRLALETKPFIMPDWYGHPWKYPSTASDKGFASIVEFTDSPMANVRPFTSATELRSHISTLPEPMPGGWDLPPSPTTSGTAADQQSSRGHCRRRLIILPDLRPRFVEALGASLGIPPAFFLAHWAPPRRDTLADEDHMPHDRRAYWRVRVPQLSPMHEALRDLRQLGMCKVQGMNLDRILTRLSTSIPAPGISSAKSSLLDTDPICGFQSVSFWSTPTVDGGWTAVLLVDPIMSEVLLQKHPQGDTIVSLAPSAYDSKLRVFARPRASMTPLPTDPAVWGPPPANHNLMSIFSTLNDLYVRRSHDGAIDPADPFSSMAFCRGILLSRWEAFVAGKEAQFIAVWQADVFSPMRAGYGPGKPDAWRPDAFQKLVRQKQDLKTGRRFAEDAARRLGLVADDHGHGHGGVAARELSAWMALLSRFCVLDRDLASAIETSAQRAMVETGIASAAEARSIGRLTTLAQVCWPFSLFGTLFSMNGAFAVGASLNWLFWVLAVPASLLMVVWLLAEKATNGAAWEAFAAGIKGWRRRLREGRESASDDDREKLLVGRGVWKRGDKRQK